jgi:hypothetical protein
VEVLNVLVYLHALGVGAVYLPFNLLATHSIIILKLLPLKGIIFTEVIEILRLHLSYLQIGAIEI